MRFVPWVKEKVIYDKENSERKSNARKMARAAIWLLGKRLQNDWEHWTVDLLKNCFGLRPCLVFLQKLCAFMRMHLLYPIVVFFAGELLMWMGSLSLSRVTPPYSILLMISSGSDRCLRPYKFLLWIIAFPSLIHLRWKWEHLYNEVRELFFSVFGLKSPRSKVNSL